MNQYSRYCIYEVACPLVLPKGVEASLHPHFLKLKTALFAHFWLGRLEGENLRMVEFKEKIDKNTSGPNFFDPKLTWPECFKPSIPGGLRIFRAFESFFHKHEVAECSNLKREASFNFIPS